MIEAILIFKILYLILCGYFLILLFPCTKKYVDFLFPIVLIIVAVTSWFILPFETSEKIQMLIAFSSFSIIFHSVYLKDYGNKRKVSVIYPEFNFSEPDCHLTYTSTGLINPYDNVPTYYIRFLVKNSGKTTSEKTLVVLEKIERDGNIVKSFLPLNLTWAQTETQVNRSEVNIPQGMFRTLDMICIFHPSQTQVVADMFPRFIQNQDGKSFKDRFNKYSGTISVCSQVKPYTFSDIVEAGEYTFYLSIASNNIEPIFASFNVKYDGGWSDNIDEMFTQHLSVELLAFGSNKNKIFNTISRQGFEPK